MNETDEDLAAQIASLRAKADERVRESEAAKIKAQQFKGQLETLTAKLPEYGVKTWAEAQTKLQELSGFAQDAVEKAEAALAAEGIL